jgi:hypothetical protein
VDGNFQPRVLESFPFDHIILRLSEITVLGPKESRQKKEITAEALKDSRRMNQRRRDRCRMKDSPDLRAPQF